MGAFLERIGVELPVIQAGMGGGIASHPLAAAVSDAGGLGTLGTAPHPVLGEELMRARALTPRPLAVNLLLPFIREAHCRVAAEAELVVTFWGRPRRRTAGTWIHQCGSVAEALAARAAGADAVIVQGVEAGGHVRGTTPALELLERTRAAIPPPYPLLLAGGIADRGDVREALEAGAEAAVLGTRFVLSEESGASPAYRRRLVEARATLLTELFGVGWAAPHRVVANSATARWLRSDTRGPRGVRALNRLLAPLARRAPGGLQERLIAAQRPAVPLFSPAAPSAAAPASLLDTGPLYAGQSVARISDVRPAAELTRDLSP